MSNTICIKHGANIPSNGVLQPYELGYVTSTGMLVIGQEDGSIKKFNHLQLDDNGYIPVLYSSGNLTLSSTANNPKFWVEAIGQGSKGSYGIQGANGQAYILAYPPNSDYYERYDLPAPSSFLTANKTYTILTTKGGTFDGTFNFTNKLTLNELLLNGKIILKEGVHYGYDNPNEAKIPGEKGQIYFVLSKEGEI